MIEQFIIGALIILLTVIIHAIALDRIIHVLEGITPILFKRLHKFWKQTVLSLTVMLVFGVHCIQMWVWAIFYLSFNILPDLEEALYFSASSFTTVGFGDLYLGKDWRLISSFQAASGFILFGWSTAFIFEVMSKIYKDEKLGKIPQAKARQTNKK